MLMQILIKNYGRVHNYKYQLFSAKIPAWMKAAMGKAPAGDRIVGGTNAAGVVPWQVSIRDNESGADDNGKPYEKNLHFCGGTILDAKTILSAAHCFPNGQKEDLTFRQIMAGSVNVQDTKTSQVNFQVATDT